MGKIDKLVREIEELIEEYRAKVEAGILRDIKLKGGDMKKKRYPLIKRYRIDGHKNKDKYIKVAIW